MVKHFPFSHEMCFVFLSIICVRRTILSIQVYEAYEVNDDWLYFFFIEILHIIVRDFAL